MRFFCPASDNRTIKKLLARKLKLRILTSGLLVETVLAEVGNTLATSPHPLRSATQKDKMSAALLGLPLRV